MINEKKEKIQCLEQMEEVKKQISVDAYFKLKVFFRNYKNDFFRALISKRSVCELLIILTTRKQVLEYVKRQKK